MNAFFALLCILCCIVLFCVVFAPATMILTDGNRDRIRSLMDAHERNLRSGDPKTVADSKKRWSEMCDFLKSHHRTYRSGSVLEEFGRAAEAMFCDAQEVKR